MPWQIPTVTEADLTEFHARHFPSAPFPKSFFYQTTYADSAQYLDSEPTESDEVDLGLYDDGTKCTLTDEQIAIFRHSEIQRLLRERRRKRILEADKVAAADAAAAEKSRGAGSTANGAGEDAGAKYQDISGRFAAELYEPVEWVEMVKNKKKRKPRPKTKDTDDAAQRKGRQDAKKQYERADGMTYRRAARELDEKHVEAVELDY